MRKTQYAIRFTSSRFTSCHFHPWWRARRSWALFWK